MNAEQQLMGELSAAALSNQLAKMRSNLPVLLEMYPLAAQMQFAQFKALREAGFSPEQAMFIVTRQGGA